MKKKKRRVLALLLTVSMLIGIVNILPVQAAVQKQKITSIELNKAVKIQLDGAGSQETVKVTTKNSTIPTEYGSTSYKKSVTLSINGISIYNKTFSYNSEYREPVVELVMTDVKTSDKYKDLFLGVYSSVYTGSYQTLIRIIYKNGKASVTNMLKTLKAIQSPKINVNRYLSYPEQGYEVNPIEATYGLAKGDLIVYGNGKVKWIVCAYVYGGDYLHSYITLTLKSGKFTSSNYPSATAGSDRGGCVVNKNVPIYKTAGGTQKVITVPKGKRIYLPGDFKFVNKKMYVKAQYGGKTGWADPHQLVALVVDGSDHV